MANADEIAADSGESKAPKRKSTDDPWYKRYPSDYRRGTRRMSLAARGAYSDILDLMFIESGGLPNDDTWLACSLHVKPKQWKAVRKELFDGDKPKLFIGADGLIHNKRADDELAEREALRCVRKSNAKRTPQRRLGDAYGEAAGKLRGSCGEAAQHENDDLANDLNGGTPANAEQMPPYARALLEARSQKVDPDPEEDPKPASLECEARDGGLAGLNGAADPMLRDVLAWMHCGTPQSAREWLATQIGLYGQNLTRDSYAKLKADIASGSVIARPLQYWSGVAKGMRDEPQRSVHGPPRPSRKVAEALEFARLAFGDGRATQ